MGAGRIALSDAERKARGTFREDRSDAVRAEQAAAKVVIGPWLTAIPVSTLPLDEVGQKKYDELTKLLFDNNKLTQVTCGDCERMAIMHQQAHGKLIAGKQVPMLLIQRMDAISVRLRIAENAPAIANPNEKNRFEGSGFSNRRSSPYRLRPYSAAGQGEL